MRTIAMSPAGRFVAVRSGGGVDVVDVQGTSPRRRFTLAGGGEMTIAGTTLCLVDGDGLRLEPLEGGRAVKVEIAGTRVLPFWGRRANAVLVGDAVVGLGGAAIESRVDAGRMWFPLAGRGLVGARGNQLAIATPGRPELPLVLAGESNVRDAAPLFGGRLIALVVEGGEGAAAVVLTASGQLIHRVPLPAHRWHAFAMERGQLVVGTGERELVVVDLRYGRIAGEGAAPHAIAELAIEDDGRNVALAAPSGGDVPVVTVLRLEELLRASAAVAEAEPEAEHEHEHEHEPEPERACVAPATEHESAAIEPERVSVSAASCSCSCSCSCSISAPTPKDLPDVLPLALGVPLRRSAPIAAVDAAPFREPAEHLRGLLELVAAQAALAIASAWHTGRLSGDDRASLPFEREVLALAGAGASFAPERLIEARNRVIERGVALRDKVFASLAAGMALPFVDLATELGLSPVATQILAAVVAPRARGEIARLYAILTDGDQCTETLLAQLLAEDDPTVRDEIANELAEDAPLVRHGLVLRDARGGYTVDDALIARLRAQPARTSAATELRDATRTLAELRVDRAVIRKLLLELREPQDAIRIVVRGRRGAGRHTLLAALAARVGKRIACIDANELPRGTARAEALRRELVRATVARAVPVVSGLEVRESAEPDGTQLVRQVLRCHGGPIVLRTAIDAQVPLDPGFVDATLRPLTETERVAAFTAELAAAGITADAAQLAHRYRIGPGTIARVTEEAHRRLARTQGDPTTVVDDVARQHVTARLGNVAQRVTRLATWDQLALPDDMLDSLRELIGRARHGRTVFDDWGYDSKIATARGLTALFYGPPGTGKTMVAGLIARELGLDLYRVDLSKVMSKWIGETEKNLGEVFDAAEDGQLMLLFDEADSLFAKRSEVKSSNDRYANVEVNYLLQRLDTFEGVAVMTTNLEGSIDPAFKRRLSMRLYFPFPDEDLRARLWEAHVTPQIPVAGRLDFATLARKFPLSGGYIRNSALRAAFLAAQERSPLTQSHLERAVLLEYRELGKLASDGKME